MFHVPNGNRIRTGFMGSNDDYGNNGAFMIHAIGDEVLHVIASDGGGWEHVSVSAQARCPTWEEMCFIKDLFWDAEDTVVQFHPKKSEYVNTHSNCLHLWKKVGSEFELPDTIYV